MKKKISVAIKNAEIVFDEELQIVEREKNKDDVQYKLRDVLMQFQGVDNLNISISTDSDL